MGFWGDVFKGIAPWLWEQQWAQGLAVRFLGRPVLKLSYDPEDEGCRDDNIVIAARNPHGNDLTEPAIAIRLRLVNEGKRLAVGCNVKVDSVEHGGIPQDIRMRSEMAWIGEEFGSPDEFAPKELEPTSPIYVNIVIVSEHKNWFQLESKLARNTGGAHSWVDSGVYIVRCTATGTNYVAPGRIALAIHHDATDHRTIWAEVIE